MTPVSPPTEHELDMATAWLVSNSIRLFFNVAPDQVLPGEQRFLGRWRQISLERRDAAYVEVLRQIYQGLLDHLREQGPRPGAPAYRHLIKEGARW